METPKRLSATETLAQISVFLESRCRLDHAGQLACVKCGGEISRVRAYMSLHDQRYGDQCMGPGRAWRMEIPFCVQCEEPPSRYGCMHMSEEELNLPSVIEASRPFGIPAKQ